MPQNTQCAAQVLMMSWANNLSQHILRKGWAVLTTLTVKILQCIPLRGVVQPLPRPLLLNRRLDAVLSPYSHSRVPITVLWNNQSPLSIFRGQLAPNPLGYPWVWPRQSFPLNISLCLCGEGCLKLAHRSVFNRVEQRRPGLAPVLLALHKSNWPIPAPRSCEGYYPP